MIADSDDYGELVQFVRGRFGKLPYAAIGAGPPVVILAGLSPTTGVDGDGFVAATLAPVRHLAEQRRLIVLNRWGGLPAGMTMADLAAGHADAIRELGAPVDVLGLSTGGSIAQQLAADHPDVVERLVLLSTACRLGPVGRFEQAAVAREIRAGRPRRAAALAATDLAPTGLRTLARGVGWLAGRRIMTAPDDLAVTIEAEDGFDLATCARPIRADTLIVAGGRDRFYGRGLFEETAALIPGSELRIFPRRGHIGVTRDPAARAAIAAFLQRQ